MNEILNTILKYSSDRGLRRFKNKKIKEIKREMMFIDQRIKEIERLSYLFWELFNSEDGYQPCKLKIEEQKKLLMDKFIKKGNELGELE